MKKGNYHDVHLGKSSPKEVKEEIPLEYPTLKCISKQHILTFTVMV